MDLGAPVCCITRFRLLWSWREIRIFGPLLLALMPLYLLEWTLSRVSRLYSRWWSVFLYEVVLQ